jgi:hypothetical protein
MSSFPKSWPPRPQRLNPITTSGSLTPGFYYRPNVTVDDFTSPARYFFRGPVYPYIIIFETGEQQIYDWQFGEGAVQKQDETGHPRAHINKNGKLRYCFDAIITVVLFSAIPWGIFFYSVYSKGVDSITLGSILFLVALWILVLIMPLYRLYKVRRIYKDFLSRKLMKAEFSD